MAKKSKTQKRSNSNNPLIFKSNVNVGNLDAESDNVFLDEAFVNKPEVGIISNIDDSHCVIIGRTGSGKTAIIKHLEKANTEIKIVRIEPEAMALTYLSNSTILNYFEKLDIKMELFYKTLWKHVFIIEFLKLYSGSDAGKIDNLFEWFKERLLGKDQSKKKAFEYLSKWKDSFWQNIEYKIKEMENSVTEKLAQKLNVKTQDILPILAELEKASEINRGIITKTEVINKSQLVVNELQIQDIAEVIKIMKNDLFDKRKGKFFIIIDDLDKEWVDKKIVYDLIKNMIDAIKELKIIEATKIIIGLRENLLNLVIEKSKSRGLQREKYESLFLSIKWSEAELKDLIEKRLSYIFKGKYAKRDIKIEDVMRISNDKNISTFSYLLDRTLMRPRDIIDFVNKCIAEADGKSLITGEMIKSAEIRYSKNRVKAIEDEWRENYPYISDFVGILRGITEKFDLNKIKTAAEEYFTINQSSLLSDPPNTPFGRAVKEYIDDMNITSLIKQILVVLYEVGVIGIKISGGSKINYAHLHYETFSAEQLTDFTIFTVHSTFHKALQINVNSRYNS